METFARVEERLVRELVGELIVFVFSFSCLFFLSSLCFYLLVVSVKRSHKISTLIQSLHLDCDFVLMETLAREEERLVRELVVLVFLFLVFSFFVFVFIFFTFLLCKEIPQNFHPYLTPPLQL